MFKNTVCDIVVVVAKLRQNVRQLKSGESGGDKEDMEEDSLQIFWLQGHSRDEAGGKPVGHTRLVSRRRPAHSSVVQRAKSVSIEC